MGWLGIVEVIAGVSAGLSVLWLSLPALAIALVILTRQILCMLRLLPASSVE